MQKSSRSAKMTATTAVNSAVVAKNTKQETHEAISLETKRSFPLVPKHNLVMVSLTGQDYPNLRLAFSAAWERTMESDRKRLLKHWKNSAEASMFKPSPFIAALPHWPGRETDEFGLTHPSGHAIYFIAPLIEIMPPDLAIGVVARELGYAYCLRGSRWAGNGWAARPRKTWAAGLDETIRSFEAKVGCADLPRRLAKWMSTNEVFQRLNKELQEEAELYHLHIGQYAARIFS